MEILGVVEKTDGSDNSSHSSIDNTQGEGSSLHCFIGDHSEILVGSVISGVGCSFIVLFHSVTGLAQEPLDYAYDGVRDCDGCGLTCNRERFVSDLPTDGTLDHSAVYSIL
jgi:hypothetical protein